MQLPKPKTKKRVSDKQNNQINDIQESQKLSNLIKIFSQTKFLKKLKNLLDNLPSRLFKTLTSFHFKLLNEIKLDENPEEEEQVKEAKYSIAVIRQKGCKFINKILPKAIPLFETSNLVYLIYEILSMLASYLLFFIFSIELIFKQSLDFSFIPFPFLSTFLFLDMIKCINTGYYFEGLLIKSRSKIIKQYLKSTFLRDVLPFIAIIMRIYKIENEKIYLIIFFLKPNQIFKLTQQLQQRFVINDKIRNIFQLIKLLILVLLMNHIFACLWALFAEQEGVRETWMTHINIQDADWSTKYINSLYYTAVTMITVGYGDIIPITLQEKMLSIAIMIVACGLFAYNLNTIGIIIQNFFKVETDIDQKLTVILKYMHKKNIKKDLQYQIKEYLVYYWTETQQHDTLNEQIIINQLSEELKVNLLMEANKIILKEFDIFQKFKQATKQKLLPLIQEQTFTPGQIIFLQKEVDKDFIYFIEQGSIELSFQQLSLKNEQKFQSLKHLKKGCVFGQRQFFTDKGNLTSAISQSFTILLSIKRKEFINILSEDSEEYEKFCQIKDSVQLYDQFSLISEPCLSCEKSDHDIQNCNLLHLNINKKKTITLYKNSFQKRKKYKRKNIKNFNSLIISDTIQQYQVEFNEDYAELIEGYEDNLMLNKDYFIFQKITQNNQELNLRKSSYIHTVIQAKRKPTIFRQTVIQKPLKPQMSILNSERSLTQSVANSNCLGQSLNNVNAGSLDYINQQEHDDQNSFNQEDEKSNENESQINIQSSKSINISKSIIQQSSITDSDARDSLQTNFNTQRNKISPTFILQQQPQLHLMYQQFQYKKLKRSNDEDNQSQQKDFFQSQYLQMQLLISQTKKIDKKLVKLISAQQENENLQRSIEPLVSNDQQDDSFLQIFKFYFPYNNAPKTIVMFNNFQKANNSAKRGSESQNTNKKKSKQILSQVRFSSTNFSPQNNLKIFNTQRFLSQSLNQNRDEQDKIKQLQQQQQLQLQQQQQLLELDKINEQKENSNFSQSDENLQQQQIFSEEMKENNLNNSYNSQESIPRDEMFNQQIPQTQTPQYKYIQQNKTLNLSQKIIEGDQSNNNQDSQRPILKRYLQ